MLGFNVDADFADCIDNIIRVDLREGDVRVLAKYMGKEQTEDCLAHRQDVFQ